MPLPFLLNRGIREPFLKIRWLSIGALCLIRITAFLNFSKFL